MYKICYILWFTIQSNMAALYLILVLFIQNSLTETILEDGGNSTESQEDFNTTDVGDIAIKEFRAGPSDWMDAFMGSSSTVFPTSSAALMTQTTNSDKSPEEKLEDIKEIVNQIATSIQSEMANLLSDAISCTNNDETDNKLRKKRSVETPMDSTQLVMRLLRHIKSNNEYQNIAIEKMMTAQEIADKFGINFTPDPDTLSDLAVAANEQAKEMSAILKDAFEVKNVTQNEPEPSETPDIVENVQVNSNADEPLNESLEQNENNQDDLTDHIFNQHDLTDHILSFEVPEEKNVTDRLAASELLLKNYYPVDTQIVPPPPQHHHAPVSQRPNFYDVVSDTPTLDYYCSMEPATTTIIISNDEPVPAEPELVAEEYEETVSSKVYINHEEAPDVSTVNHVMSYTLSEKAHFRKPNIESLPQQMQYYFLLI